MKGFLGIKGILILVTLLVLFGGAMYDLTTTGVRCGLAASGQGNYTCDEFGFTVGTVFVFPDRNIASGVDSILILREYSTTNPEMMAELAGIISVDEQGYKNQILIGIAGLIVLIGFLMYIMIKITPSSLIHIDSKFASIMLGLLLYIVIYLLFTGLVEGNMQLPFSGLATLIQNPSVLTEVVDHTSALPGTLTVDDIINNGEIVT